MLDRLASLDVVTTVIVGENDTGLREAADKLAATVPGATLVVIPGAGHSPQEDQPTAWLSAVESHLARASG
jgi:pimeloyl-ACP methyl ester carboxylesterase